MNMRTIDIDDHGGTPDFARASQLARDTARQFQMQEPTIIAWHQHGDNRVSSYYDGADPDTWPEKYGAGNGGELQVRVGYDFDFILMDAKGYETLGEVPLRSLSDAAGHEYLCYTPLLDETDAHPTSDACTELDDYDWITNQL